ncbi:MAG TPA: hypothetical protein VGS10_02100 [Terracidiphilus sp.]|nr:hypothetical protein [Terracidiphilus sp.]
MNKTHAAPAPWHPDTQQDREAILSELRQVLASPHFCNSKRYPALLEYVVEHVLNGNAEMLKERTLGVEVFGRRADYDTNTDTVVRYTASEVRKRLLLYYSELDHAPGVRILLPTGSYIPEFLRGSEEGGGDGHDGAANGDHAPADVHLIPARAEGAEAGDDSAADARGAMPHTLVPAEGAGPRTGAARRLKWRFGIAGAVLVLMAGIGWFGYRALMPQPVLNDFWKPVLQGQGSVVVCTGSVVFAHQPNYSGTTTAGRDINYTFVSMQIASAINELGLTIDRTGQSPQLLPSASTALPELREHSVILLGGYNNQWTMRLLAPLRFHFSTGPGEAIEDALHPQMEWKRDTSLPYSSADDYAIVARFRDPTIDGWVVALAGIGRNGSEAAAQFATSPHYMQLLRDRIGKNFAGRNIEAVLKVNVIDGKTGAPSILAVHSW